MSKVLKDLDVAGLLSEQGRRVFSPNNPSALQNLSAPPVQHGQLWYDKDDRDRAYIGTNLGPLPRANLATNPAMETIGAAVAVRTNLATHGTGNAYVTSTGTNLGWNSNRWFGGGTAAGTYTNVTGATDGPLPTITSYARKTWTAIGGANGDLGFSANDWTGFTVGAVYVVSAWFRSSIVRSSTGWDVWFYDATGVFAKNTQSTVTTVANVWTRFSTIITVPPGTTRIAFIMDTDAGTAVSVGTTFDVTGLQVEQAGAIGAVQRTNLCTNPSFERSLNLWQSSGNITTARDTTWANGPGTASAKVTSSPTTSSSTSGDLRWGNGSATVFPAGIVAGTTYTISAYINCPAVLTTFDTNAGSRQKRIMCFYSTNGSTFVESFGPQATNTTGVQRISHTFAIPANATGVIIGIGAAGSATDMSYVTYIDSVLIEAAGSAGVYFDGFSIGNATTEYAFTGAVFESSSVQRAAPTGPILDYFDGAAEPALRTNWATDPRATNLVVPVGGLGWGTGRAGGTYEVVSGATDGPEGIQTYVRKTMATASNPDNLGLTTVVGSSTPYAAGTGIPAAPGETFTVSAWQRIVGTSMTMRLKVWFLDSTGARLSTSEGSDTVLYDGVWTRMSRTFTVPAGNSTRVMFLFEGVVGSGSWTAGNFHDGTGLLLEKVSALNTYFDALTTQPDGYAAAWVAGANASASITYDKDLTNGWTGTAYASTSTLSAPVVNGLSGGTSSYAVSSTRWKASGSKSMRQTPRNVTGDSYALAAATSGGGGGGGLFLLQVGKTYSVRATLHQEAPMIGTPHANGARQIVLAGVAPYSTIRSTAQPNVAGDYEHTITFTAISANYAQVRLYHGYAPATGQGDLWWDNLVIEEAASSGPYFDGDTGASSWTGTPHASSSFYSGPAWVPLDDPTQPIIDPLDSGVLLFDADEGVNPPTPAYVPTGSVSQFAGATAPSGWLLCDGSLLLRASYPALFAVIGTAYNVGGEAGVEFRLPDLKGRVPVGRDVGQTEFDVVGETGGAKVHILTAAEMPSHTHVQNSHNHTQDAHTHALTSGIVTPSPISGGVATPVQTGGTYGFNYATAPASAAIGSATATNQAATATNQNTGGGGSHNNLQPYLVLNYIIKI